MDQGGGPPQPSAQDGQQQFQLPEQAVIPPVLPQPIQPAPLAMNWSLFKPEFLGKPKKNSEAHIYRMIDRMDTHNLLQAREYKDLL